MTTAQTASEWIQIIDGKPWTDFTTEELKAEAAAHGWPGGKVYPSIYNTLQLCPSCQVGKHLHVGAVIHGCQCPCTDALYEEEISKSKCQCPIKDLMTSGHHPDCKEKH